MVKIQTFTVSVAVALVALLQGNRASAQNAALVPAQTASAGAVTTTTSTPNWVGSLVGKPIDNACYRKSHITKQKKCGRGYEFDNVATCWAECPLEYPVECGMECLPQNEDCTKAVLRKVTSVANVALTAASSGVFGQLSVASKGVQQGVKCGQQLFTTVNKIVGFVNEVESSASVDTTKDQILYLLSKSDFVIRDLPIAVTTCLGLPAPTGLEQADQVVKVIKSIIEQILSNKNSGIDILKPGTFLKFASSVGVGSSLSNLTQSEKDFINSLVSTGATCGPQIKSVIDRVVLLVKELKAANAASPLDAIRLAVLNSDLLVKDLPAATLGCINTNAPDGFKTRDEILKTVHVIIDRVVEASSQNGNPVSPDKYAITIANLGLDAIAMFDPTGLAAMAKEFVQPICGPTVFVGDIDDGAAEQALGLRTVQKAFRSSSGLWTKQGNGLAKVTFKSVDDHDVTVNILSGGNVVDHVKVGKGKTVTWSKPLADLQGKTMYMDRWRPGFLGIPGTGGGSLLLWVPLDADGALQLNVQINPTSFSDKDRRE